ncbi:hypothetical protein EW145_g1291 [Phellinidium pouzarii]|uniref:DDHD domain-containing protein n=1 Tax=Phellinidium pouzarii TaxID=167371 RepID=A0A4S4LKI8_9AGAM|nr:hypothetical protein EW145_g1291 [Phellinidium pouzarii]
MADDDPPPRLAVRWMRPQMSSALLELPTVPIVLSSQKDVTWQAFTAEESSECEEAWQALSDQERRMAEEEKNSTEDPTCSEDIDDDDEEIIGVSIAKDKLFEVDVRSMRLRPIYWEMNAPPVKVLRGTWFYDNCRPVSRVLSNQLEELYLLVKPWLPSYEFELSTAFELGPEAHMKLKQKLDETHSVVFENSTKAYLVLNTLSKRFLSFLPSSSNSNATVLTFYPGSTPMYRGYDAVLAEATTESRPRSASVPAKRQVKDERERRSEGIDVTSGQENVDVKQNDYTTRRGESLDLERPLLSVDNKDGDNVTDLIFIIHGIGQGLATQYEGYNFVYAANLFRQIARKQSTTPALSSVMRNRRVQFLPVQWRTNLKLGVDEERRRHELGLDNEFTLNDITIKNTVPYVRELVNNVLIDIPYFMSHHKDQMIRAVAKQANRIYRLWCARNPGFDVNGRVHVLAHSLGSALAGHILSNQPTIQPPLSNMIPSYVKECSDLFVFNTRSFFMIGSPFPLFIHINRTQTIARKGRERTVNSPPDEASDAAGNFGCLAVDSVYNIFNPSDPIAYLLNPTVDARTAKDMPPSVIKNVNTPLFNTFSSRMSRLLEGVVSHSPKSRSPSRLPMSPGAKSGFELGGTTAAVEGTKEERRYLALNPRGTLDFSLPSEGNISGYFGKNTILLALALADFDEWSFSNEIQPWQWYIHGPGATSEYLALSPSFKNLADTSDAQGIKITIDGTSFWEGQTMERSEIIPQTSVNLGAGHLYYHFSLSTSTTNPPNPGFEHQIAFFESHFTEIKYGLIDGEQGTTDNLLRWDINSETQWSTELQPGNWYNFAYDIDFSGGTVGLWASNGSDPLTQIMAPVSASPSTNSADWHIGELRLPNGGTDSAPEDWYWSGIFIESGSVTTSIAGPDAGQGGSAGGSPPVSSSSTVPTPTTSTIVSSSPTSTASGPVQSHYGQCGGTGWTSDMADNETEVDSEPRMLTSFEKLDETTDALETLLSRSLAIEPTPEENKEEIVQLQRLTEILALYQEQPYLLDPHLEKLVTPIVDVLRSHARDLTSGSMTAYSSRPQDMRFFPHEVSDLSVAMDYMKLDGPVKETDNWALRYLVLLWLSLVCMLPFDLSQFDNDGDERTAFALEKIARVELDKAGIERDGASLMLSRLYMRKDSVAVFTSFLDAFELEVRNSPRLFTCIGSLQVIAEVAKSASSDLLETHIPRMQAIVSELAQVGFIAENTVVRKLRTKSISRIATRMIPMDPGKRRQTGKSLLSGANDNNFEEDNETEYDAPTEVEAAFEELFELLQDKDTSVRWSSAKGLSRISERLPLSFALSFDVRKGSFSVGSNVRDAASYVIWSLARTQRKDIIEGYATGLAQKLVTVALFDREIHIRRAASAAFQENVGRMAIQGLFPHGIAVLGKTDFYSVSIRRNAFLIAAPQVAIYDEYMQPILLHLFEVTVRHWDENIRRLGAQAIRKICELDLSNLGPQMIQRASTLLISVDTTYVHGGLLTLSELASAFQDTSTPGLFEHHRRNIFDLLGSVPSTMVLSPHNHLLTEAACHIVANSISSMEVEMLRKPSSKDAYWKVIVTHGLRHRHSDVQEAAAAAMAPLSLKRSSSILQQSLARVLGSFDYSAHNNGLDASLSCLLDVVDPSSPDFFKNVEARRFAYTSLARIVTRLSSRLDEFILPDKMSAIFDAFFNGIDDYTVNERGDVGSWVRLSCVKGFCSMFKALISQANNLNFVLYLPLDTYHRAVGNILKQGVERLDNVLKQGEEWSVKGRSMFIGILKTPDAPGWNDGFWLYPRAMHLLDIQTYRMPILRGLLLSIGSRTSSTQRSASSAMLAYARTLDLDGENDAQTQASTYSLYALARDLLSIAKENPISNSAVVPVLQIFNILLEGDVLLALSHNQQCIELLIEILDLATKNIERLRSMQRAEESMKIAANMLSIRAIDIRTKAVSALGRFLQHRFPKVLWFHNDLHEEMNSCFLSQTRSDTAEALYDVLQTRDIEYDEAAEDTLLDTEWSADDLASLAEPTALILTCLRT